MSEEYGKGITDAVEILSEMIDCNRCDCQDRCKGGCIEDLKRYVLEAKGEIY